MEKIDSNGDPLTKLNEVMDWEIFRSDLDSVRQKHRKMTLFSFSKCLYCNRFTIFLMIHWSSRYWIACHSCGFWVYPSATVFRTPKPSDFFANS